MPKVGIVMGSDSDLKVMSKAADMLDKLGIEYDMTIISAHREPDVFFEYAKTAEEKGYQGDHCGSRNGSTSSGNVCSNLPDAGNRYSDASGKNLDGQGCTLFYRADAVLEFQLPQ